ncbi:Aste57867_475 [Aphanomyces stellatus]|uniref:Aste57867_475 protein n=1 Tax=Aphanomyces stellatus TaxID=120398 RepID=A0A485K2W5_9STRA|nr:hypothetical protein As57867_000474 [Aphanomyces stellatus]VFT77700.1 Aste57867_475 [Aphanomyces stellatus]
MRSGPMPPRETSSWHSARYHEHCTSTDDEIEAELQKAGYVEDHTFTDLPLHKRILLGCLYLFLAFLSLYAFMSAIKIMGESFTLIFACNTNSFFTFADSPVAGLMVGIIATSLLHSSGTVTSVTVAIVAAKGLTVRNAVPIIMGANIGTCVTCVMVAFAQISKRDHFERAMAAAMIHDMYNIWSVIVLFPLELLFHPLEELAHACTPIGKGTFDFQSPVDAAVKPFATLVLLVNQDQLVAVSNGTLRCQDGHFIASGMFKHAYNAKSMGPSAIGGICLALGFVLLVGALILLVRMLTKILRGTAQQYIRRALGYNGYLNVLFGTAITFCVHSSTIVTSTITPMAGLGVITLDQVYPLVIGANVGTTVTALLASWVTGEYLGVQIALVHFWFNIFGIFLFYPIPATRHPILHWSERIGHYSARWPVVALLFLLAIFILIPGLGLALSYLYRGSAVAMGFGIALSVVVVLAVVGFYWWYFGLRGRETWHYFLDRKAEHHRMRMEAMERAREDEAF